MKQWRPGLHGKLNTSMKLDVERIRLDWGGYDRGGRYFGSGAPLFRVTGEKEGYVSDRHGPIDVFVDEHVRAPDAREARRRVAAEYGITPSRPTAKRDPRPRTRGFRTCGVGMEVQTLLFPRGRFTPRQAIAWAKSHNFRTSKIHATDQYLRVRHRNPNDFQPGSFRTIDLSGDVRAVVGCPRKGRESDVKRRGPRRDAAAYAEAKRLERGIKRRTGRTRR